MPYVITEACANTKDRSCVDVCPVNAIYEGPEQLYIDSDECICCAACVPECPVTAIFDEDALPSHLRHFAGVNRDVFTSEHPPGPPRR